MYTDFVSEYLRNTGARAPLSRISEMERQAREHDAWSDSRMTQDPIQDSIQRFFVLPTKYSYGSPNNYHSNTVSNSVAQDSDAAVKSIWSQWENELLTLRDTKSVTKTTGDKLFADFKRFVERKYADGEITLEGGVGERLDALEKALHEEGLEKAEEEFKHLRPQIGRNLLAEMDKHRAFISDSLELTLLSRELPDRLLVYRAIVSDPQVEVARKLLTGGTTKLPFNNGDSLMTIDDPAVTPTVAPRQGQGEPEVGALHLKTDLISS